MRFFAIIMYSIGLDHEIQYPVIHFIICCHTFFASNNSGLYIFDCFLLGISMNT